MTNWQKVRVQFNDADGNEVSAGMWKLAKSNMAWASHDPSFCLGIDTDADGVTVTPIREVPTGLGAVIRVIKPIFTESRDLYCHTGSGWWTNGEGGDISAHAEFNGFDDVGWQYEILSEGIQL